MATIKVPLSHKSLKPSQIAAVLQLSNFFIISKFEFEYGKGFMWRTDCVCVVGNRVIERTFRPRVGRGWAVHVARMLM